MPDAQPYTPPRSAYALLAGSLEGRPDVTKTKATTIRQVLPMVGDPQTYTVQTYRDESGDTIFVEYGDSAGLVRLALTPAVSRAIARQRESLTTSGRRTRAKVAIRQRMADGWKPTPPPRKKKNAKK